MLSSCRRGSRRRRSGWRPRGPCPVAAAAAGRRRRLPGDEADTRFFHFLPHKITRVLPVRAADLADHDHGPGLRVLLERREAVDEAGPDDRVAADADAGGLPVALGRELVD